MSILFEQEYFDLQNINLPAIKVKKRLDYDTIKKVEFTVVVQVSTELISSQSHDDEAPSLLQALNHLAQLPVEKKAPRNGEPCVSVSLRKNMCAVSLTSGHTDLGPTIF